MIKALTVLIEDGLLSYMSRLYQIQDWKRSALLSRFRFILSRIYNITSDETIYLRQYNTRRLFTTHIFNTTVNPVELWNMFTFNF